MTAKPDDALKALIEEIEQCEFFSVAGPLRNCDQWIELRRRLGMVPTFVEAGCAGLTER